MIVFALVIPLSLVLGISLTLAGLFKLTTNAPPDRVVPLFEGGIAFVLIAIFLLILSIYLDEEQSENESDRKSRERTDR